MMCPDSTIKQYNNLLLIYIMNIHLKIKECVNQKGAGIIVTSALMSMLDDKQVFDEAETLPYKKILRNIIQEGYAQKLLDLGEEGSNVKALASQYSEANQVQEALVRYVFDCLVYGLGWSEAEPKLQPEGIIWRGKECFKAEEYDAAFSYLSEGLKDVNDPEAQNMLGDMYKSGNGIEENLTEAIKWYRKAAEQDYAAAQFNLGIMYHDGNGVEQDYVEAMRWCRKAAEQDYVEAQEYIGLMYRIGRGVEQDDSEAMKWFRKAAEQNYAAAQSWVGFMYQEGKGVEQDYAEAMRWYRKAAEQNDAAAQNNIGVMYQNGNGVEQDYAEAMKWYRKAAEQNYAVAQFNLGWMYHNGYGVAKNDDEAVKLYRLAAEQGNTDAQEALNAMTKKNVPQPSNGCLGTLVFWSLLIVICGVIIGSM